MVAKTPKPKSTPVPPSIGRKVSDRAVREATRDFVTRHEEALKDLGDR